MWKIEGDHEIRLEVGAEKEVTIKMTSGQAELFGSELSMNKEYTFTDAKFAIFTWYVSNTRGCVGAWVYVCVCVYV